MPSNETPERRPRPAGSALNRSRAAFGPAGFAGKIALATLALILLFAIVGGIVLATHMTHREVVVTPKAQLQQP
jgi:hypothetical protein